MSSDSRAPGGLHDVMNFGDSSLRWLSCTTLDRNILVLFFVSLSRSTSRFECVFLSFLWGSDRDLYSLREIRGLDAPHVAVALRLGQSEPFASCNREMLTCREFDFVFKADSGQRMQRTVWDHFICSPWIFQRYLLIYKFNSIKFDLVLFVGLSGTQWGESTADSGTTADFRHNT